MKAAAKSPANGSKNFMSPTISAASKFTPSPRKKILVERNDPVRTSISLSDGKASFFSEISSETKDDLGTKSELAMDRHNSDGKDVLEGPRASKASKRVTFLEVPSDTEDASEVKPDTGTVVDSGSKNTPSCFPVSPVIAPLDADPSLPPYDPKTNYLSPRPQFLHYKPNPRIEVLLNKEKGLDLGEAKRLDDSFMLEASEKFSDSDGAEGSISEDSQKDSECSSSAENVLLDAEAEEVHAYEESTIIDPISDDSSEGTVEEREKQGALNVPVSHDMCEGIVEVKDEARIVSAPIGFDISDEVVYDIGKAKPRFFRKLISVSLLLILLTACISFWATESPMMDSSSVLHMLNSCKLREPLEYAVLAKANFNGLGERFKQLAFDSIFHLSLLINNLGRGDNLGTVKFINLTDLQSDMLYCGCLEGHQQSQTFSIRDLEEEDFEKKEDAVVTDTYEDQTFAEVFSDDSYEKESEEESKLGGEKLRPPPAQLAEIDELESTETHWNQDASSYVDTELKYKFDSEANLAPVLEAPEVKPETEVYRINPELTETGKSELDISLDSRAKVEFSSADYDHESTSDTEILADRISEAVVFPIGGSENKYSAYSVMGMASLVLALVSAATFVYYNSSNPKHVVHADGLSSKKVNSASSVPQKIFQERASSHNWATEVDVEGESCPSEMSSFERSSSYSRKDLRGANEAQSQERKPRKYSKRESLASSSSELSAGSPSYGSFTTYERISGKHVSTLLIYFKMVHYINLYRFVFYSLCFLFVEF